MSFNLHWSDRKTDFWKDNTPKVVAPGTYNPENNGKEGISMGKEAPVPFNSIKEREVHEKGKDNPGPGFYNAKYSVNENRVSSANANNSFTTKVPRFAPMAPGSTVFKTASSFFNPGPGSYFK